MPNVVKIIGGATKAAAKAAGKNVKPSIKAAQNAKPLANPKSGVRVKPPAKTKPAPSRDNKNLDAKFNSWARNWSPEDPEASAAFLIKNRISRIENSKRQTASGKASRPVESPKTRSNKPVVKVNSAPKKK